MRAPSAPIQTLATFAGATFLLAGILGFIPGITSRHGDLAFAGHGSRAQLLGIFQVSILLNLVHLLFGIAGLAAARAQARARGFLVGGGAIYLALWLLGLANGGDWIPLNTADNWLDFGLGSGMIGLGLATSGAFRQAPHQNDAAITR